MKFIPNSKVKDSMLKDLNLKSIDYFFSDIPKNISLDRLNLPKGLSQQETEKKLRNIARKNKSCSDILSFIGGGIKTHYLPPAVKSVISRSEFFTAYTPYQSEASQGFLQAMFEYQSMIAELTGMDIANCSLYDGFTALGEAALMSTRINRKKNFLIPQNISWEKKSVLKNYTKGLNLKIKEIPYDEKKGVLNLDKLKEYIDEDTTGLYIENPNFFGIFEDSIDKISKIVKDNDSIMIVGIDPISLGIIKSPGEYGADIVIGEGRALGNPMDFGGSSLGIFACKNEFLRQMPGRIIGMTNDAEGKRSFCMALQTREQHIRRGRATSNICTNEGLCALAATTYLSLVGSEGLTDLSRKNFENGKKLSERIVSITGYKKMFSGIHFNEFVINTEIYPAKLNKNLLNEGIQGGLILDNWYPELNNCILFGITELYSDEDIENFATILEGITNV